MSWLFKPAMSIQSATAAPERQKSGSGVKEDFSAIGETIGRQFREVASFLAPPPLSSTEMEAVAEMRASSPTSKALVGIRNDLAEIGGSLKSGFSKFTSSFMQFQSNSRDAGEVDEDDEEYVAGLSDDVLRFVGEISKRPECWTDFPLPLQNDFRMSDAQRDHASAISELVPSITNLKANLYPFMGGNQFWFVYFILLLPRLNQHDLHFLSSKKIAETRNLLLENLKSKKTANSASCSTSEPARRKHSPSPPAEITEIVAAAEGLAIEEQAEEKNAGIVEDTSFSEVEDEESDGANRAARRKGERIPRTVSSGGSSDWVQLQDGGVQKTRQSFSRDKDSDIESVDWLKVEDFD